MVQNNPPIIKPGMKISGVIELLGNDYQNMSGSDILNRAKGHLAVGSSNQFAESGFWIFNHPAGQYLMIVQDGYVVRVDGQPSGETQSTPHPETEYFELERPQGDGLCSDDTCPCKLPENRVIRGSGYLYISREVVEMRRDARTMPELTEKLKRLYGHLKGADIHFGAGTVIPILMCEQAVKRRGIDMQVAAADAKHWWETGLVPVRPTPMLEIRQDRSVSTVKQEKKWWEFWK
jgi:hypothetical protein